VALPLSGAIDNCRSNYLNSAIPFLSNQESASWKSWAEKYSCMGLTHSTKIDTSVWIQYFTSYRFLYEQISSCDCSVFSSNISLSEILGQATYTTWWKHIDPICPTFSCVPYSFLFPLHWQCPTVFQDVSLTSVLGESIQEHSEWDLQCGALGFSKR
jgi:hypothetical protein